MCKRKSMSTKFKSGLFFYSIMMYSPYKCRSGFYSLEFRVLRVSDVDYLIYGFYTAIKVIDPDKFMGKMVPHYVLLPPVRIQVSKKNLT